MFCGHDLTKTYLMIVTIITAINYCDPQENPAFQKYRYRSNSQVNHLNRHRESHNSLLALLGRKKEFRNQQRKLDNEILQNNIQLLNAETKADILKLQNPYLENYSSSKVKEKYPSNTQNTDRLPEEEKIRIRREEVEVDDNNPENENSKDANNLLLHEIIDELDEIKDSSIGNDDKGEVCHLNGTWKSDLVGIAFTISFVQPPSPSTKPPTPTTTEYCSATTTTTTTTSTTTPKPLPSPSTKNNTVGDVEISAVAVTPDEKSGFQPVMNCSWNLFARIPFSYKTMLIITAEYPPSSHIAVFVGQCRYCEKNEMIIGQWMVQKFAHDCKKVQTTEDVFGDVLKRHP